MTTTITPTEARERYSVGDPMLVADSVIDLIDRHPHQHDQGHWGYEGDCGTTCCIAGWVGELHGDSHIELNKNEPPNLRYPASHEWKNRQRIRLGLTEGAAQLLFTESRNSVARRLLQDIAKFHADSDGKLLDAWKIHKMKKRYLKEKADELQAAQKAIERFKVVTPI